MPHQTFNNQYNEFTTHSIFFAVSLKMKLQEQKYQRSCPIKISYLRFNGVKKQHVDVEFACICVSQVSAKWRMARWYLIDLMELTSPISFKRKTRHKKLCKTGSEFLKLWFISRIISWQDISWPNIFCWDISLQNISLQNISRRNISRQNISQRKISRRNIMIIHMSFQQQVGKRKATLKQDM